MIGDPPGLSLGGDITLIDGPGLPKRVAEATGKATIRLALDAIGDTATLNLMGTPGADGTLLLYAALARRSSSTTSRSAASGS